MAANFAGFASLEIFSCNNSIGIISNKLHVFNSEEVTSYRSNIKSRRHSLALTFVNVLLSSGQRESGKVSY